jgi:hypothetical protein
VISLPTTTGEKARNNRTNHVQFGKKIQATILQKQDDTTPAFCPNEAKCNSNHDKMNTQLSKTRPANCSAKPKIK